MFGIENRTVFKRASTAGQDRTGSPAHGESAVIANPPLNIAPFGRWTLHHQVAPGRLALGWTS